MSQERLLLYVLMHCQGLGKLTLNIVRSIVTVVIARVREVHLYSDAYHCFPCYYTQEEFQHVLSKTSIYM